MKRFDRIDGFYMKKVLVVAYAFPPVGGVGTHRVTKFVKYLREFSWEPLVLTVSNPSVPIVDDTLLQDIPEGVRLYYAPSLEPSYSQKQQLGGSNRGMIARVRLLMKKVLSGMLLPDVQVLWWPGLIRNLISLIKIERPSCLFVTAPPFSSFIPVVAIGRFFKIPVVVDFRDEWSFSRDQWENTVKGKAVKILDRFFESYVVSRCSGITAATLSYVNTLASNYNLPADKAAVIANGFDEEDFFQQLPCEYICKDKKITVIYCGTVWNGSSLKHFFKALNEILITDNGIDSSFQFKLYGRITSQELPYFQSLGLERKVNLCGFVDHSTIVKEMSSADVLLLVISDLPGSEKIIVAKTFEYMATGKHIFAMVPEGETKKLLSEHYGNVTFARPDDSIDIKDKFLYIINNFDKIKNNSGKDISQYSRRFLTGQLAKVFDRVTSN